MISTRLSARFPKPHHAAAIPVILSRNPSSLIYLSTAPSLQTAPSTSSSSSRVSGHTSKITATAAVVAGGVIGWSYNRKQNSSFPKASNPDSRVFGLRGVGSYARGLQRDVAETATNAKEFFIKSCGGGISLFSSEALKCDSGGNKEMVEIKLCHKDSMQDGDLKVVKTHGDKEQVLVARIGGQFHCTGNSCSHYSAPLQLGIASKNHTVACPWHYAEFDLKTGKVVNGPALDSIPVYPITIKEDGYVYTSMPAEDVEDKVIPVMAKRDPKDKRVVGIVGAGPAALTAAESLRQEGYTGRIVMFGRESHAPYDRPVLSKNFTATLERLTLRSEEFLRDCAGVEFERNSTVTNVDVKNKVITTAAGQKLKCSKILIASGSDPRKLNIPGSHLTNIHTVRTPEDAKAISKFANLDSRAVVIGSSFIGMEIAAALAKAGTTVTVIGMEEYPLERVLGPKVGKQLMFLLNSKRVNFRGKQSVKQFKGANGAVSGVVLENGEVLQADLVVLGVGVIPNTDFVTGVDTLKDKSLLVDPFMQIVGAAPGVYAAGDIATFPYYKTGDEIRVEHWDVAMQQGRTAAVNMTEKEPKPFDTIPFFWTMMLGKSIRYCGHCKDFDEVIIEGSLDNMQFVAYYIKDEKVQAVATCGKDPAAVAAAEALRENLMPSYFELKLGYQNAEEMTKKVRGNCAQVEKK